MASYVDCSSVQVEKSESSLEAEQSIAVATVIRGIGGGGVDICL